MKIEKKVLYFLLIVPFSSTYIGALTILNHFLAKKLKKMWYLLWAIPYELLLVHLTPLYIEEFFGFTFPNAGLEYLYYYLIITPLSLWMIKKQESVLEEKKNHNEVENVE